MRSGASGARRNPPGGSASPKESLRDPTAQASGEPLGIGGQRQDFL